MELSNKTAAVLGRRAMWPGATITFDDSAAKRRIRVYGTGEVVVQHFLPERQELRYELRLTADDVVWLFEQCVEQDVLTIERGKPQSYHYVPMVSIYVQATSGRAGGGHKWQGDENPRFDVLAGYFEALEQRAIAQGVTYSGREERLYKPARGAWGWYWQLQGKIESLKLAKLADLPDWLIRHLPWRWIWIGALIAFWLIIAYVYVWIDPQQVYGFGGAIGHGFFVVQNGLLSLIDGRVAFAPQNNGWWYNIGYTVGMVLVPGVVRLLWEIVKER